MEIANLLQPMGMDPSAAVATGTGQPATTAPVPEGAFALFFARMMNPVTAVSPELMQSELRGENADAPEEEQHLQQAEPAEKQSLVPADLTAELQALALLNTAPAVPVQLSPDLPEEHAQVEAVSTPVIPEATPQATAAPVDVSKPVVEGDRSQNLVAAQSAFVPAQARPATEPAAPETAERGQVDTTVLSAQKEPAGTVRRMDVLASPARETEVSPKPVVTEMKAPAPVADEAPASEPVTVAAKAAPAQEAGLTLRQAAAVAEDTATEPAAVTEETGEAVAAKEEVLIKSAVRDAGSSSPANHEQAEQHLAQQGKEMPAQPVAVATEALRETEAARQSLAPTPAEQPASEHEHIMHQVKEKLAVHSFKGGNDQISFTLHPEELGELKIVMKMNDQRLKVEIVAQNQTVREALMQNLEGLKETLSRQNITVDRFDVNTGGGTFNQAFHEGRHTGRDRYFQPYTRFTGGSNEPEQKAIVTAWLPRENSLVDVRL